MKALARLRTQIRDLTDRYIDEDGYVYSPLLTQLLVDGPFIRASNDVVGKIRPRSTPPGNLSARDLYDHIHAEGARWATELAGHHVRASNGHKPIEHIPDLAAGLASSDERLHGEGGLYSDVGRWHSNVRVLLGYDRKPSYYPMATCPSCHHRHTPECPHRENSGGTIRARETLAYCANSKCRDEQGQRHEFSILYLRDLLRQAAYEDLEMVTAATGMPA